MNISDAPAYAFLAMYAEDMHRSSDTGNKLRAPDPDPRLVADFDLKAFLIANDSILSAGARLQVSPEPLYYGYVAQRKSDPQSWIVGVRGTAGIVEWIIDGQFLPEQGVRGPGITVEHGFWSIYETMTLTEPDGITVINQDAAAGIAGLVGPVSKATVVGHSLGSALATYLAFDLQSHLGDRVSACLFASPRTGNQVWVQAVHNALADRYLVVNYLLDIVPQLPTGPDYDTLKSEVILKPSTSQAGIELEIRSNHHVLCYAAMLSYVAFKAMAPSLLDVDRDEYNCVLGDSGAVPLTAKVIERSVEAAQQLGVGTGDILKTLIRFGAKPHKVLA